MPPPLPNASPIWWFALGREPLLSSVEIRARLPDSAYEEINGAVFKLGSASQFDSAKLIRQLGGTIKIAEELGRDLTETAMLKAMVKTLERPAGKITFGISFYNSQDTNNNKQIERWGKKIKEKLRAEGRAVRYVFKNETVLSSATVAQNNLDTAGSEFLVTRGATGLAVAATRAVQPFKDLSARDYGRPRRDDKSGMLPPKLAMMMINIATASPPKYQILNTKYQILDPFCGSGTILTEALLLGYKNIIGCDLSDKAIEDTKKNIAWTQNSLTMEPWNSGTIQLFQSDIRDLSRKLSAHSMDAIVTEPYLGPPLTGQETGEHIRKNISELTDLYLAAFQEFKRILKPAGVVVFLIPRFFVNGKWLTISDQLAPRIKKLGFTSEPLLPETLHSQPFLLYHRPGQRVGREVWKFKF